MVSPNFRYPAINLAEYDREPSGQAVLVARVKCVSSLHYAVLCCNLLCVFDDFRTHPQVAERHYPELFEKYFPEGLPHL